VIIWNKEPLMGFETCHIYVQVLQLFTEIIVLPPNAVCIECYYFRGL
jgi:hypothetical protein